MRHPPREWGAWLLPFVSAALMALGALFSAGVAGAAPAPPDDLSVQGGTDSWHADNWFRLDWINPKASPPVAAVRYRVRDVTGKAVIGDARIDGPVELVDGLVLPMPGAYDAEVWLEDTAGSQGSPATAKLRFDNARPGNAAPDQPTGWLGRTGFPYTVHIGHPSGEPPLSGIRGYAVSLDSQPDSDPCAGASGCTDSETSLHGGVSDDSLSVVALPEGTSYVHAVAVSGSGMKSPAPGHAELRVDTVDPLTTLSGAPQGWSRDPVTLIATAADTGSGMSGSEGVAPLTAIRVDDAVPTVAAGALASATVIAEGVHRVAYYARDAAGNVNDGQTSNGKANHPPATATVRIDHTPPQATFASTPPAGDPELIQVRVRDPLSGPDLSRGWIGVRRAGSGDRFEALPGGPAPEGLQARWNSDAYAPGTYEFRAVAYDQAGNAATTTRHADGTAMVLPSPLKIPTTLRARLAGPGLKGPRCLRRGAFRSCRRRPHAARRSRPRHRLVAFGRRVRFGGRLTAGIAAPLEGTTVRVAERFGAGAVPAERISQVRTGAGGAFAIRLPAGPSRQVTASFGGTAAVSGSTSRPVWLGVRSRVRMHASTAVVRIGGRPVVFSGRIAAGKGAGSPGERAVQLQFRLPGLRWSEFRTVRTDRRGRFRYRYRFSDDDSRGARFQFRAYVPAQGNWPYEPAGSRPVAVRGR